jgi:hypothetical protein
MHAQKTVPDTFSVHLFRRADTFSVVPATCRAVAEMAFVDLRWKVDAVYWVEFCLYWR